MIVASLATCSAMDVASIASKKRQAVERYEVHVVGDQRDEYPQVLTEATVTHEFWGTDLSEAALRRAIELSATKYCPVNAMVSAGATTVHHRYAIHSTGARALRARGRGPGDRARTAGPTSWPRSACVSGTGWAGPRSRRSAGGPGSRCG